MLLQVYKVLGINIIDLTQKLGEKIMTCIYWALYKHIVTKNKKTKNCNKRNVVE